MWILQQHNRAVAKHDGYSLMMYIRLGTFVDTIFEQFDATQRWEALGILYTIL